jgi:hypothetical protein
MDFKEYGDRLTELGTTYITEGARAWESYTRAIADALSGKARTEDLQKRFTQIAFNEGPELARKLAQCNIDYYMGVMNAGFNFGTQLFESTFKKATQPGARTTGKPKRTAKG